MNEYIKGPWYSDGNHVSNEDGLIATAMTTVRLSERVDETRFEGESWLAMRRRTEHLREENKEIEKELLTFIAAAPEMYEALKFIRDNTSETLANNVACKILNKLNVRKDQDNG